MLRRKRPRRVQEIPQSSLSDLAFLLLVFFITSMDFTIEQGLPFVLPSAQRSMRIEVEPSEVMRVQVLQGNTVTVDGAIMPVEQIAALLRNRNTARRAAGEPELIVVIETHPDAEYQMTVGILDQIKAADSRRVSLQALKESP
jgi:biopolymer transport protein ExbD